jgi:DNA-binding NtrC family response regulator
MWGLGQQAAAKRNYTPYPMSSKPSSKGTFSNAKILVVDAHFGNEFAGFLSTIGFHAVAVESMRDAMQFLYEHSVDLVITEDLLGDGSGPELCRQIKVNRRLATPFVLYTGHEIPESVLRRSGIDLLLFKPLRPDALVLAILPLIHNQQLFRAAQRREERRSSSQQKIIRQRQFSELVVTRQSRFTCTLG